MDVDTQVSLVLYIGFKVRHFKVVIHKVNHEVREPGILTLRLKQAAEKLQTLLPEVISENLERH